MSNSNIISLLNNRDKQILIHIYKFRGLTFEQILNTLYSNNGSPKKEYCRKRISLLKKYELIEKVDYPSHSFYFLTTRGAILVKNLLNLSIDIDLKTKRGYSENYFMASELKFKQPLAEHQYYLNEFVLNFCNLELPIDYKFYSEKNVCKLFDYARPDAVIETDNMYYCLEMDMGTERINKLNNKWTTYRDLLMSSSFSKIRKPITILFFIKSNNINHREKICIDTFYSSLFDLISDDFNLYTGDIDHCFNKLIESIKIQLIADTSIQDSMSFKNYQKKRNYIISFFINIYW